MYLRDWNCWIHVFGEGALKEACVCPADNASVVGVEMYVDDLLVVAEPKNDDSGGEFDFDWGVHGSYHGVCVGALHGDDEVGELCGDVLTKVGKDIGAVRAKD